MQNLFVASRRRQKARFLNPDAYMDHCYQQLMCTGNYTDPNIWILQLLQILFSTIAVDADHFHLINMDALS